MTPGPDDHDPEVEIRRRLLEAGASSEEVDAASDIQGLIDLSGEVALRPAGAAMSLRGVAAGAGIPVERAQHLSAVAGILADDVDLPRWFESDVGWMRDVDAAVALFGEGAVLALLRRAGAAMTQLAHASSSAFRVNVVPGPHEGVPSALDVVERNLGTRALVQVYVDTFTQLYRHHIRTTIREESVAAGDHGELRFMCVGFVDLSSSTELGERVTAAELARLIADFEAAAFDAATRNGARVVKTIGDEVMVCADDPNDVCRAALDLVAYCRRHRTLSAARGGVAAGDLLEQDGDCYGPVVNRAARFVQAAADGTVMVDVTTAAALGTDLTTLEVAPVEHRGMGTVEWSEVRRRSA